VKKSKMRIAVILTSIVVIVLAMVCPMGGASRIPASNVEGAVRERAMLTLAMLNKKPADLLECLAWCRNEIRSQFAISKQTAKQLTRICDYTNSCYSKC